MRGLGRRKSVLIIPESPTGLNDSWELDACFRQVVRYPGEVTVHPVEDADDLTDHERHLPVEISVAGIVTDTPVGIFGLDGGELIVDRAIKLREKLLEIRDRKEPVVVVLSMVTVPSMTIRDVTFSRGTRTGAAIEVDIVFSKRRVVQTGFVPSEFDFDASALGAAGTVDGGTQTANPVADHVAPAAVPG